MKKKVFGMKLQCKKYLSDLQKCVSSSPRRFPFRQLTLSIRSLASMTALFIKECMYISMFFLVRIDHKIYTFKLYFSRCLW